METEKAERENMAKAVANKSGSSSSNTASSTTTPANAGSYGLLQGLAGPSPSTPSLSAGLGAGLLVNQ